LPVLCFEYDLSQQVPKIYLGLALFGKQSQAGFRFETPEGKGTHNYYHAQPTRTLNRLRPETTLQGGANYPSVSCPTFTLEAENVVTLLVCFLITVYGKDILRELQKSASFFADLMPYVSEMLCVDNTVGPPARYKTDIDGRWCYS